VGGIQQSPKKGGSLGGGVITKNSPDRFYRASPTVTKNEGFDRRKVIEGVHPLKEASLISYLDQRGPTLADRSTKGEKRSAKKKRRIASFLKKGGSPSSSGIKVSYRCSTIRGTEEREAGGCHNQKGVSPSRSKTTKEEGKVCEQLGDQGQTERPDTYNVCTFKKPTGSHRLNENRANRIGKKRQD